MYTSSSPLISQMYIYGNSLQTNIVAVVVPQSDGLMGWWKENHQDKEGIHPSYMYNPFSLLWVWPTSNPLFMRVASKVA